MNVRLTMILAGIVILAFGVLATACGDDNGGGGALTLDEYFQRLEEHATDFENRGNAVEEEFDITTAGSEEEALEAARGLFSEGLNVLGDFVDDLENLDPPSEAEGAHASAVEAGRELEDMFGNAVTVLNESDSIDEASAILEAPGFTDASDAFTDACFDLQDVADANSIDVDLLCN